MEQSELLRFVVSVLERLDIPYFVTGSTVTGIVYSDFDLTLQRVVGGNARTRSTAPFKLSNQVPLEGR